MYLADYENLFTYRKLSIFIFLIWFQKFIFIFDIYFIHQKRITKPFPFTFEIYWSLNNYIKPQFNSKIIFTYLKYEFYYLYKDFHLTLISKRATQR